MLFVFISGWGLIVFCWVLGLNMLDTLHLIVVYFHYLDLVVVCGLVVSDGLFAACVFWDLSCSYEFGVFMGVICVLYSCLRTVIMPD